MSMLRGVREARAARLQQHRDILDQLGAREGSQMVSTNLFCCARSCVWIHAEDGDVFAPNVGELKEQSSDGEYRIDPEQLVLGKVLGRGGNGCVYVASYCGFPVAVKEMFADVQFGKGKQEVGAEKDAEEDEEDEEEQRTFEEREREKDLEINDEFQKEFENLRRLRHPNVIDLYGTAVLSQPDTHMFRRLLVMELAACSMRDVLRDESNMAPMATALLWAKQVASGLAFLHSRGLIHFDVKPANVLLDMSGNAKVCDLGVARPTSLQTPSSLTFTNSARVGTPSYMAPELLRADVDRISNSIDVYSFGVMLWEVAHRESPHPRTWGLPVLFKQVASNRYRPEIESDVPQGFADLIRWCWAERPDARPTCEQIVQSLEHLAPTTPPRLLSSKDTTGSEGESFLYWTPEARCFLSDCVLDQEDPNGLLRIEFEDGQPAQEGADPRNIILERGLPGRMLRAFLSTGDDVALAQRRANGTARLGEDAEDDEDLDGEDLDDETLDDEDLTLDTLQSEPDQRKNAPAITSGTLGATTSGRLENTVTQVSGFMRWLVSGHGERPTPGAR